jgi:hypothetical protein
MLPVVQGRLSSDRDPATGAPRRQTRQQPLLGLRRPAAMVNRELALHFALRSNDGVEVGMPGGDLVVRRAGWLARMLRGSCPRWRGTPQRMLR